MGDGLGAVDQHWHAAGMGLADQVLHRIDGAQGIGNVHYRDQPGALVEQAAPGVQVQLAAVGNRRGHHPGAAAAGHQLPGHDVGVMLHAGHEDLVAGFQPR